MAEDRQVYQREWCQRNRDKVRAYNKRAREKDPEKYRAYQRDYQRELRTTPEHKAYRVRAHRKLRTGFTPEMWDSKLIEQVGLCAICREAAATEADHNHVTNTPRGILCGPCNRGLGQFSDDTTKLVSAIHYLEQYGR